MKKALLSLLAVSSLATPAIAGYSVDGYHFMSGDDFGKYSSSASQLLSSLDDVGVVVLDGNKNDIVHCDPKEDGSRVLGFYAPKYNLMVICTNNDIPSWVQFETLVHETVHVVQDARDGIDNDTLVGPSGEYRSWLGKVLNPQKRDNIMAMYDQKDWAIEAEAFHFENQPEAVNNELRKYIL